MSPELKSKIAKIYELVKRGSEGERQAAKLALGRILAKHNLEGIDLDSLDKNVYYFKYSSANEARLFKILVCFFLNQEELLSSLRRTNGKKTIKCQLNYGDWITLECAYEYFRRHMKSEWNKISGELKRCRKTKTLNKRRAELQDLFFTKYVIASKLVPEEHIITEDISNISQQEQKDRAKLSNVEGGQYNKQVSNGLLLN